MSHHYCIVVLEALDSSWSDWFDGLTITARGDGTTILAGHFADQSALYGSLNRARDLNLTLVALHRVEPLINPLGDHVSDYSGGLR